MAGAEVALDSKQYAAEVNKTITGATNPKGDPADVSETRKTFMTATWFKDPNLVASFNPLRILYFVGETMRYKGPNPHPLVDKKMPVHPMLAQHLWVFPRAMAPVLLQVISMKVFNFYWPVGLAMAVYAISFIFFAIFTLRHFNEIAEKYGFLDAKAKRDTVPDIRYTWTAIGLLLTVTVRPIMGCFLAYDRFEYPHFTWMTPIHMFVYICTLDFYYYWAHRASHEVSFLWRFHKTHHMTKHPSHLLSAFADEEQDLFDILGCPLLTYLTYPIDFHTWWLTTVYILFVEAAGHTGTRVYWCHPVTGPVLRLFGMELIVEDHDLHHRFGWKSSWNYGKQTRIWDTLFGTRRQRIEMIPENIDSGFLGDFVPRLKI